MINLNKYKVNKKKKMNAEADEILEKLEKVDIDALYRRISNKAIESENEKIDNTLLNKIDKEKGEESLETGRQMFEFLKKNETEIKAIENEARRLSNENTDKTD